jgi:chromate transport protein ChrA
VIARTRTPANSMRIMVPRRVGGWLGGTVSGLLAPLPVLGALMTASHHRRQGSRAVQRLVPGIAVGLWGGVAFFAVVAELVYRRAPSATYLAAACAAVLAVFLATRVAAAHPVLRFSRGCRTAPRRIRRRAAHILELARS